jgi:hypothetical protein
LNLKCAIATSSNPASFSHPMSASIDAIALVIASGSGRLGNGSVFCCSLSGTDMLRFLLLGLSVLNG